MEPVKIFELFAYCIPALITSVLAFFLFSEHFKSEEKRRKFVLLQENQKQSLPIRLQAYERMSLFLERINPSKLLLRVPPYSEDKNDYESHLIHQIEQEFEHNLAQQIYVSNECWTMILSAKNATIQMIRNTSRNEEVKDADKLREAILSGMIGIESPIGVALTYLKNEVSQFL